MGYLFKHTVVPILITLVLWFPALWLADIWIQESTLLYLFTALVLIVCGIMYFNYLDDGLSGINGAYLAGSMSLAGAVLFGLRAHPITHHECVSINLIIPNLCSLPLVYEIALLIQDMALLFFKPRSPEQEYASLKKTFPYNEDDTPWSKGKEDNVIEVEFRRRR